MNALQLHLLLANGLAGFFEGAFGFGGSLVFLALTVPWLGWSSSLGTDCVCASANLLFVAGLASVWDPQGQGALARRLVWRSARHLLWAAPLCAAASYGFLEVDAAWKVILFGSVALATCGVYGLRPRRWFLVPASVGMGLCNSDAPFGFLYFQGHPRGKAAQAFFLAVLLWAKLAVLLAVLPLASVLVLSPLWFCLLVVTAFLASAAGHRALWRLGGPERRLVVITVQVLVVLVLLVSLIRG